MHNSQIIMKNNINILFKSHSIVLVDLNEVHQSFKKCGILTPDIRKQPQTFLETLLKVN